MTLKSRLSKLERTKREVAAEAHCICFPPEEPPDLELQPEIEAARAVRCPLHGERFKNRARTLYRVIGLPTHLDRTSWMWRSAQYIKAMEASFPPDRWPATQATEPDGTVRFVLKDGTEIHRLSPVPTYSYTSGELTGFVEGYPPKFRAISNR
jgi:hypothetical protein